LQVQADLAPDERFVAAHHLCGGLLVAGADPANELREGIRFRHGPASHGDWQRPFCCIRAASTRREKSSMAARKRWRPPWASEICAKVPIVERSCDRSRAFFSETPCHNRPAAP